MILVVRSAVVGCWTAGQQISHLLYCSGTCSCLCFSLGFGNECGLAIVDIIQKTCLLNMGTPDLYGKSCIVLLVTKSITYQDSLDFLTHGSNQVKWDLEMLCILGPFMILLFCCCCCCCETISFVVQDQRLLNFEWVYHTLKSKC